MVQGLQIQYVFYISVQSFFIYILHRHFFFGGGGYLVFERARELRGTG